MMSVDNSENAFRNVNMRDLITRAGHEPPRSALYEYVKSLKSENSQSTPLSLASDDSWDSTTHSTYNSMADNLSELGGVTEDAETRDLIYKLCHSLHKKAVQRIEGSRQHRQRSVEVNVEHEKNMSHIGDWMPLLHLFDPQTFYAVRGTPMTLAATAERPFSLNVAENPKEASQLLLGELDVEKLSGGNSNHVYRLAHPDFPGKTVLLRVYGSGDSEAIDRFRDVMAMREMSRARLSPAVLHSFKWGRVEEFMEGVATCSTDMLLRSPTLLAEVWLLVHKMHSLPYASFLPQNVNNEKIRHLLHPALAHCEYATPEEYCDVLSKRLKKVVLTKKSDYYLDNTSQKLMEDACPSSFERTCFRFLRLTSNLILESYRASFVSFISAEVMLLRELLMKRAVPLVFSHNDLNPGNILLAWRKVPKEMRRQVANDEDEEDEVMPVTSDQSTAFSRKFLSKKGHHRNLVDMKGIIFIDFEYTDVNYRCFDLGNTICELDYDYTRGTAEGEPGFIKYHYTFPPEEYREQWKGHPMTYPRCQELIYTTWQKNEQHRQRHGGEAPPAPAPSEMHLGHICLKGLQAYFAAAAPAGTARDAATPITRDELTEVFIGTMCSHLSWSLWSLVMCANPDVCTNNANDDLFAKGSSGLDYIYYGNCRLQEYVALKQWMRDKQLI
ncbi:choline/ethanolamine kinase [Leishmania donovani]|uniref:Choline/ethanolamine kinase, putative n=1 Tax=Leishmania donovani TaxID=5661 RepID=A0A3Q8IPA3_LEIDO|nr:choline/ethanolamine kinase, putative [Leishmania donovani]AYU82947.1 choline/ethanolamine kinase, putative [Leishmania donovani]CAJ1992956.1 choline/ethanolamine kinase [Leishmania donovani]CBZ38053.1 choline/ethanolamine kinase, putative [Leishmania donovani]VDZ48786.1 choline/ethanolamine_kinase_putative/GeneDB:LmjF.35.1470 [Leishmania donovani]